MSRQIKIPEAIESERVVLGSILLDQNAFNKVIHLLSDDGSDFYLDKNRTLYLILLDMHRQQQNIDIVSTYEAVRGAGYEGMITASDLATITSEVATATHIVTHAKIVVRRSVLRKIIWAARDIVDMTQKEETGMTLDETLDKVEARLKGVTRESAKAEEKLGTVDLEEWRQIARDTEERNGQVRGISTGIKGLDEMLEGFEPGEMMILTGHTKHGKSRLAANIAKNVANQGKTVFYVNTEMTKLQMGRRFNSMLGDQKLSGKIILNDQAGLSYNNVLQMMERMKEKGADLVIVDHLHFFSRSIDQQTNEISKIAKDFKDAAVELEIPLIMLCHLQQADTKKKPTLQMIKNSSSIAQDADIVVAVWIDDRPDSPAEETQILRLAHRSASGTKKKTIVYNDGMNLSEINPNAKQPSYNPDRITEGGARLEEDDIDF